MDSLQRLVHVWITVKSTVTTRGKPVQVSVKNIFLGAVNLATYCTHWLNSAYHFAVYIELQVSFWSLLGADVPPDGPRRFL